MLSIIAKVVGERERGERGFLTIMSKPVNDRLIPTCITKIPYIFKK